MGLDMNFYKKDYVEIDYNFRTRDRELFDYITTKCGVKYGDDEYSKYIVLNKRQINKIIKYMSKHNENGIYSNAIAEMNTLKEKNEKVYMCADW